MYCNFLRTMANSDTRILLHHHDISKGISIYHIQSELSFMKQLFPHNRRLHLPIYVTGFARKGLIRAPLQNTDFTTILWIHHQTIHVCMFCGQQFTSLLFLRLLSETCQTSMNARFVFSRLCWKVYQAERSHMIL